MIIILKYEGRYPEIVFQKCEIQVIQNLFYYRQNLFHLKTNIAFELGRHTHHAKTIFVDGEYFSWYGQDS